MSQGTRGRVPLIWIFMQKADLGLVELKPQPSLRKSDLQREAWWYAETKLKRDF